MRKKRQLTTDDNVLHHDKEQKHYVRAVLGRIQSALLHFLQSLQCSYLAIPTFKELEIVMLLDLYQKSCQVKVFVRLQMMPF